MKPVFFIDRSLGAHIFPDALTAAGVEVRKHDDFFPEDATDEEWIAQVAQRGWFALSNDRRIYRNPVQRQAVLRAGLGYFVLTGGSARADDLAQNFISSLPAIERFIDRTPRPFLASVQRPSKGHETGKVELRYPK